jgi:hypothetical protein
MASFEFRVNKSFLNDSGHPITIPKSSLPYDKLLSLGLDHDRLNVVLPRGETFEAAIYHGTAGYGEYYQIRFQSGRRDLPSYLSLNDLVVVTFETYGGRSLAKISAKA